MKIGDLHFEPYIKEKEIINAIQRISDHLNTDLEHENPLFLGVLNGAFLFAAEITKGFAHDCEISFVKVASYERTTAGQDVKELIGLQEDVIPVIL